MAGGGILHRVTNMHYNLYNENEELVGHVRQFGDVRPPLGKDLMDPNWYGVHHDSGMMTAGHTTRHRAARDLMEHHEATLET